MPPWKPPWLNDNPGTLDEVLEEFSACKISYESNLWQTFAKIHTSTSALVQCDADMINNGTWHETLV